MTRQMGALRNRFRLLMLKLARAWLRIVLALLFVYCALPWLAPTMAKLGLAGPADLIYTLYSPFCHQFAFRSVFVYGEQAFYPRAAADSGYGTFEEFAASSAAFQAQYRYWNAWYYGDAVSATEADLSDFSVTQQIAARHFIGDDTVGYKTSLCARDLAIYSMMFVGALIYARYRWRIRPLSLWLYVVAGLLPIGIDGFSQLLSYPPFELWPTRETLPVFRVLTGGLFGLMSAWLGLPHIERSMYDLANVLSRAEDAAN